MWLSLCMRFIAVFLLLAPATLQAQAQDADSLLTRLLTPDYPSPPQVSVLHLIAHPERYHERMVVVSGYLHNQFEDHALYLSKEDADYGVRANAIAVGVRRLLPRPAPRTA